MVTVAALIGGGGLGTFVFQGIGQTAIDLVLLGAIPIVALAFSAAVVLDALVRAPWTAGASDDHRRERSRKHYGAATVVDDVSLQHRAQLDHGDRRHLGLGQVDAAAHDQPPGRADRRPRAASRAATPARSPRTCCAGASATPSRATACSRTARSRRTSPPCRGCSAGTAARIHARVQELLARVPARPGDYAGAFPHQLSGGQQQRVGVARALAAEPAVLLMDEPFGALDPIIRAKAQEDLLDIQRRFGTTVVLVTHDMDEAFHLGDARRRHERRAAAAVRPPGGAADAARGSRSSSRMTGLADRAMRLLSLTTAGEAALPGRGRRPRGAARTPRCARCCRSCCGAGRSRRRWSTRDGTRARAPHARCDPRARAAAS